MHRYAFPACAFLAVAALALASGCVKPQETAQAPPREAREITGFSFPESVLLAGDRRFVSNLGAALEPTTRDGDGFISELDAQGAVVNLRAFTGLNAPKGMAMVATTLYAADIDTVVGIDTATGARVMEVKSPNANAFLNDIAVESDDALLVTDTAAGALYRVRLSDRSMTQLAAGIPGANGVAIAADGAHAIVAAIGADFTGGGIYQVSLSDGAVRRLGEGRGLHDGAAALADGDFIVSDWVTLQGDPGALRRYHADGAPVGDVALPAVMKGPADFAYDAAGGRLWIPRMLDGAVSIVPYDAASAARQ